MSAVRSRVTLVLVLAFAALVVGLPAGRAPLWDPNEARYMLLARDILDRGRWLIPDLRGEPYLNKPQLFFWSVAVASLPGGEVTERTAAGEGTIGRLTSDEHLIDEVETGVEGISDVVGAFTRLRTIVQLRSEYNFLSNTFKNYFSFQLFPREGRYFLIQLIDDPRGRTEFTTTQVRRSPPAAGEPEFYEEQRVTTSQALLFSLMLAQRVYFATFRFGILESSGGLGLDLNFFDERLVINADVFQFGHSQFPRIRTRLSYEIIDSLFILGGVDDFLNERTIDFFLGAMLSFDDNDLASLFPFFGGALGSAAR